MADDAQPSSSSSAAEPANTVHLLKFNAPGVWSNVIVPAPAPSPSTSSSTSLTVTVDSLTSDLCLGLVAPTVQPMNCQPGNPIAFLTLMWNATHNRVYFLNHPLVPLGTTTGGKPVAIVYHADAHTSPAPGLRFTIEVDAADGAIRGRCSRSSDAESQVCFEIKPVTQAIRANLGAPRFGMALSGDNDRVRMTATFPLDLRTIGAKADTLVLGETAADAKPPSGAGKGGGGGRASFEAVAVNVESVLSGFRIQPKYRGAAERRQHIDVNEAFPGCKKIHSDPDIYEIDGFLSPTECQRLMVRPAVGMRAVRSRLAVCMRTLHRLCCGD